MRALRQWIWFRPVTTWSTVAGLGAATFYLTEGRGEVALVRALAGGFLLLVVGFAIAVRAYYHDANKRAREPDRGALPRHVRQISESYMLALIFITIEIWLRAGEAISWRLPLAAFIGVRGLQSLYGLIAFERRRVFVVSPYVTDLRGSPQKQND